MYKTVPFSGKLEVSISGTETVLCGDTAIFKAEVTNEDPSSWSLTWQKTRKHFTKSINISKEKYSGSTDRKLVITSVSKKNEWRYQAVLSRNSNGNKQKILSNEILLQALGGISVFHQILNNMFYVATSEGTICTLPINLSLKQSFTLED